MSPRCGHSACSQHFIDTGSRECVARASTRIRIIDADTGRVESTCTLASFYEANDMTEDEQEECERALANWGAWMLGGGAASRVRIELAP